MPYSMPIAEPLGTAAGWGLGHLTKCCVKGALKAAGLSKEAAVVSGALAGGCVCFVVDYTVTACINVLAGDAAGFAANHATTTLETSLFTAAELMSALMKDQDEGKTQTRRAAAR